ncbi:phosphatidylglycerophosphatase A family protein [Desulfosoma caldarium]|uniref:Phosphatidylglycerophosphatase n=1 Tax=Desulfosoma caldarium TaxID=610254 RepID=A0A3N1UHU3_9BACT|nr:phosphatidylglycerophosphatase A [Desulfosoma caldarium]ROQ90832.1 phosphatidylglycerophosphatase [Desulfosoma caldarium]
MSLADTHQSKPPIAVRIARLGVLGTAPVAPGTVATIAAGIPVASVLSALPHGWACLLLGLLFVGSCWVAEEAQNSLGHQDPQDVVIDELIGFLFTTTGMPATPLTMVLGVLYFRAMDILKPWPVCVLDRQLKGGLGIVADDVAAGLYAHGLLAVTLMFVHS